MVPPRSGRVRCLRPATAATGILVVAVLAACGPATTSSTSSAPQPHTTATAKPSATGSSAGASPTQKNCVHSPHTCGYPDETNTGWSHTGVRLTTDGVTLTAEREFNIDTPGTVVDGKDIQGCVNIKADNVTIKRSRIRCDSYFPVRVYEGGFKNAVLEDDEIDGMNAVDGNAAVGFDYLTLRRLDIHSVVNGPRMGDDVLVEDSYVHDLIGCQSCNNDIQSSGARNVVVRHNTLVNDASGKNAVVLIATEMGSVAGFTVENNLLAGGNYAVQVHTHDHGFPQGVRVLGNRIVPTWQYGPFDVVGGTIEARGNYLDDSLAPVSPE